MTHCGTYIGGEIIWQPNYIVTKHVSQVELAMLWEVLPSQILTVFSK